MEDFKGTKGKWHYDKYEQIIKSRQHLQTEYICEMLDCDDDSEIAPNAQLIAAAPELLEILQYLVNTLKDESYESLLIEEAQSVINKALGKENENV